MLTKEQRAMRRTGIGASEIAMVAGLAPLTWGGPLKVWKGKVEEPTDEPEGENVAIEAGDFLEDGAARWYAAREGIRLSARGKTERHPLLPWMLATPDRYVVTNGGKNQKRIRVVQVKVPQSDDGYGEEGTDDVPVHYICQVQWEMEVTGIPEADLVVLPLKRGTYPRVYRIKRDEELIRLLVKVGERFWQDYVLAKTEPPVDGSATWTEHIKAKFPGSNGVTIEANADDELKAQNWRVLRAQRLAIVKAETEAYNQVIARIAGNEGMRLKNGDLLSFKQNASGGTSHKAVAEALSAFAPAETVTEIVKQNQLPGPRVLREHVAKINKLPKPAKAAG